MKQTKNEARKRVSKYFNQMVADERDTPQAIFRTDTTEQNFNKEIEYFDKILSRLGPTDFQIHICKTHHTFTSTWAVDLDTQYDVLFQFEREISPTSSGTESLLLRWGCYLGKLGDL